MSGRSMSDEHVCSGVQEKEATQSDNHQSGELDVPLSIHQTLHRHQVLLARPYREARMGMPFTEVVEASEIRSGLSKEGRKGFGMMVRAADEMSGCSGRGVD